MRNKVTGGEIVEGCRWISMGAGHDIGCISLRFLLLFSFA